MSDITVCVRLLWRPYTTSVFHVASRDLLPPLRITVQLGLLFNLLDLLHTQVILHLLCS